jgi:hypothetical protein
VEVCSRYAAGMCDGGGRGEANSRAVMKEDQHDMK